MRRREFITLVGGAAVVSPLAVRAQPENGLRRIGVLMNLVATNPRAQSYIAAFSEELRQLGWVEAKKLHRYPLERRRRPTGARLRGPIDWAPT